MNTNKLKIGALYRTNEIFTARDYEGKVLFFMSDCTVLILDFNSYTKATKFLHKDEIFECDNIYAISFMDIIE